MKWIWFLLLLLGLKIEVLAQRKQAGLAQNEIKPNLLNLLQLEFT